MKLTTVVRQWVFPSLRIFAWLLIAGALVKLAFFGGTADASAPLSPTGSLSDPTVQVSVGSLENTITASGTVWADEAIPVRATATGEVQRVSQAVGNHVDADSIIATVKVSVPSDDPTEMPQTRTVSIRAGAAGALSGLDLLVGQQVSIGQTVGQVAPPGFHIEGTIQPQDQYRLLNQPTEATVTVTGGPAPFSCTGLTVSTPLPGSNASGTEGGSSSSTTVTPRLRCTVPGEVTVFAGLSASLSILGGAVDNALIVPATAVEGIGQEGTVYLPGADGGAPVTRAVKLGLNNGTSVQITDGLQAGDVILQFIPSRAAEQSTGDQMSVPYGG